MNIINKNPHINNIILILILVLILFCIYHYQKDLLKKKILIEVDISKAKFQGRGPVELQKGISKVLPYESKYCKFIPFDGINITNLPSNIDFFYISYPSITEQSYMKCLHENKLKKIILGPVFVPANWFRFPNLKLWKERRFREILISLKASSIDKG